MRIYVIVAYDEDGKLSELLDCGYSRNIEAEIQASDSGKKYESHMFDFSSREGLIGSLQCRDIDSKVIQSIENFFRALFI